MDGHVAPFPGDGLRTGDDFTMIDDSPAAAGAHDDTENQFLSPARAVQRLGHRETIGVILHFHFPAEKLFEVRLHRLAVHADGVGIFQPAGARRDGAGGADAESMRRVLDGGGQFIMQSLDPPQNVGVTPCLLRIHALAEKFLAWGIQNNAFNFRAAEVYADAKHVFKSSAMAANCSST